MPDEIADPTITEIEPEPAPAIRPASPSNSRSDAEKTRARQALELQRERILSERTSSPHRRSALSTALASVEEQLSELGWMLHL